MTRWYFVVDGQVGRDFSLLGPDDRPLTKRQLVEQIGSDAVTDRPIEHRTAVDARLFGLGGDRFEQLLTLVLTLRRPQLAKNLDPKGLSRTLSDGLRPLDDSLIDEAAHSFGDMENVQRTLDGLVQADAAAGAFLAGYTTYLRTHARAACDAVAAAAGRGAGSRAPRWPGRWPPRGVRSTTRDSARTQHAQALQEQQALTARLASLKASPAYRDREQLGRLAEITGQLEQAARRDAQAAVHAAGILARRLDALRTAEDAHRLALAAVARVAGNLIEAAQDAGIDWDSADNDDDGHLAERATARTAAREDDVTAIRSALAAAAEASRHRDRAATGPGPRAGTPRPGRGRTAHGRTGGRHRPRTAGSGDRRVARSAPRDARPARRASPTDRTTRPSPLADQLRTALHEAVADCSGPRNRRG